VKIRDEVSAESRVHVSAESRAQVEHVTVNRRRPTMRETGVNYTSGCNEKEPSSIAFV